MITENTTNTILYKIEFLFSITPSIGGVTEKTTQPSRPAMMSMNPTMLGVTHAMLT